MAATGIDLGTTKSLVAQLSATGHPALCPDKYDASQFATPTVVSISQAGRFVGQPAEELATDDPQTPSVRLSKLHLGEDSTLLIDHSGNEWNAVSLSSLILSKLKDDASFFSSNKVTSAVITVPAGFTAPQRLATKAAGSLAGFSDVAIVDEPTAAAIYHGLKLDHDARVLIYDFGGGTFDCSVLQFTAANVQVLATVGDAENGGAFLDRQILNELHSQAISNNAGSDFLQRAESRLLKVAEQLKISVGRPGIQFSKQSSLIGSRIIQFMLTTDRLSEIATPMVEKSLSLCDFCLKNAGLTWRDLDHVVLAGGSSQLEIVPELLRKRINNSEVTLVQKQPHQAIAFGAAMLANQTHLLRTVSVASLDLGVLVRDVKTNTPVFSSVVNAGTPLPASVEKKFLVSRSGQERLVIDVFQSAPYSRTLTPVRRVSFGLPCDASRGDPLHIRFYYTAEGMVEVRGIDKSGCELTIESDTDKSPAAASVRKAGLLFDSFS